MYFEAPPQSGELYGYLFRLSEALNVALNQVEQKIAEGTEQAAQTAVDSISKGGQFDSLLDLKALIINTAEYTRAEMDVIKTNLHGEYEAISSDYGSFKENIDTTITTTAEGVLQEYNYSGRLDGVESYQTDMQGYIRQGFIGYEEDGITPLIGIAVGKGLTATKVVIDGEEYTQLNEKQSCAFYTDKKVSFRQNGVEVAYLSSGQLFIGDANVTGNLTVNGWLISNSSAGLTFRYTGG